MPIAIPRVEPWTSQPPYPTRIARHNHLSRGLVFAFNAVSPEDATGNYGLSNVSTKVINRFGVATNRNDARTFVTSRLQSDVSRTVLIRSINDVTSGASRSLLSAGSGGVSGWGLGITTSNQGLSFVDYGINVYYSTVNAYQTANECQQLVFRRDRGVANDVRFYDNAGQQLGAAVSCGSYNVGTYQITVQWEVNLALLWERCLTDTEIVAISRNPWQIFEP